MTDRGPSDDVRQQAHVSDRGRSYQAGKDQYVSHIGTQHVWGPGSGPAPRALASLPPAPWLTGREERTDELLKALAPGGAGAAVTVVTGLPGVGESALALHAAHRAVGLGHFPGGTLFVHLRGYDPTGPINREQALESLLRALGVRDRDLPATVEEQAGLYQSELARRAEERGPVLIVADDASPLGQLRPLVPAHRSHRLLATSRDALTAPDVRARPQAVARPGHASGQARHRLRGRTPPRSHLDLDAGLGSGQRELCAVWRAAHSRAGNS